MHQAEIQRRSLWDISTILGNVDEFIIQRKQASSVDGDDSYCDVEFYTPNKRQLNWCAEQAAPYFTGISRIDLYAAVSGREHDIQFAERALKRKSEELDEKFNANKQVIDSTYHQIMAVTLKSPEPIRVIKVIPQIRNSFRRILRRLCA